MENKKIANTSPEVVQAVGLVAVLVGFGTAGALALAFLTDKVDGQLALGYALFGITLGLLGTKLVGPTE